MLKNIIKNIIKGILVFCLGMGHGAICYKVTEVIEEQEISNKEKFALGFVSGLILSSITVKIAKAIIRK
jgi:hypothetical protein